MFLKLKDSMYLFNFLDKSLNLFLELAFESNHTSWQDKRAKRVTIKSKKCVSFSLCIKRTIFILGLNILTVRGTYPCLQESVNQVRVRHHGFALSLVEVTAEMRL